MKPGPKPRPAADRFWVKVQPAAADECWIWTARRNAEGYGTFMERKYKDVLAHRWAYEHLRAPIPCGLTIDHLCRNRACVNPWHLEPVPIGVNRARARTSHCQFGHPMSGANLYQYAGKRQCRECALARRRARYAELRGAA